jgi:hypothetical protein
MEGNAARGAPHICRHNAVMNDLGQQSVRFDTSTGKLIHRCLRSCQYHDDLIEEAYPLAGQTLPFVTFAHRPHDARSSCMAFLPQSETPRDDAVGLRELGAPLIFFVGDTSWEMWSLRTDGSRFERGLKSNEVEGFFTARSEDFAPGAVFRAKTWARAHEARQLDFVDVGLLPLVESEAGHRLRQLFEDMVAHTMGSLIKVDLPAPFSPQSAWISPARRSKLTFLSATTPGNFLTIFSAWRTIGFIGGSLPRR